MELKEITKKIKEYLPLIKKKYKVKSLSLFGSCLKGKQTKRSDIDLLVEFYGPIDLFKFIELENFLSKKLGVKVDLVMKDTLKPRIKEQVLKEAVSI